MIRAKMCMLVMSQPETFTKSLRYIQPASCKEVMVPAKCHYDSASLLICSLPYSASFSIFRKKCGPLSCFFQSLGTLRILSRVTLQISTQQKFASSLLSILGVWIVIIYRHSLLFLHNVWYDVFGAFPSPFILPIVFLLLGT